MRVMCSGEKCNMSDAGSTLLCSLMLKERLFGVKSISLSSQFFYYVESSEAKLLRTRSKIFFHVNTWRKDKGADRSDKKTRKKLLDDLGDRRGYSDLKEEALYCIKWRNRFGRGCGPVLWQITDEWMNEWMNVTHVNILWRQVLLPRESVIL
jgi:hypothetical protein